eukprot:gene463-6874_t
MKVLLLLLLFAFAIASNEISLGRIHRQKLQGGTYFFELKEDLKSADQLLISITAKITYVPCNAYISHESHSTSPGPSKYQYKVAMTSGYKVHTIKPSTDAPYNKGKYYITVYDYQSRFHEIIFLGKVIQKTHEIDHAKKFTFKAGDKNNAVTIVKTSYRAYNSMSIRAFFVETKTKNPPKDAFINGKKIEGGKQKFFFEFNTFGSRHNAVFEIEGNEIFEGEIKVTFSHTRISTTRGGGDTFYKEKNELQNYFLDRRTDESHEQIYVERNSNNNATFSFLVNYIPKEGEIPYVFPTKDKYEYKSKQYVKNGVFWGSYLSVPRKEGQNFGLSVGSENKGSPFKIMMKKTHLSAGGELDAVFVEKSYETQVYAYQRRMVVYALTVEFYDKVSAKFSYQHTGSNQVVDIGTFSEDFTKNVTLTRGAVLYPTMKFIIKSEKPNFIRLSWKLLQWG